MTLTFAALQPRRGVLLDDPPLHGRQRRRLAALERRGGLVERQPGPGQDRADQRRDVRAAHAGVTCVSHAFEASGGRARRGA